MRSEPKRGSEEGSRFDKDKLVGNQKLGRKREWDNKLVRRSDWVRKEFVKEKWGSRCERDVNRPLAAWE